MTVNPFWHELPGGRKFISIAGLNYVRIIHGLARVRPPAPGEDFADYGKYVKQLRDETARTLPPSAWEVLQRPPETAVS